MILRLGKIDKLSTIAIIILIIGVLSSIFNFGFISVIFSVIMPLIFIVNTILVIYGLFFKKYLYIVGAFLLLISYPFFFQVSIKSNIETQNTLSLLTFNVKAFKHPITFNSSQSTKALPEILKFIDSLNVDILVLQESSYKESREIKGFPHYFLGYRENINKSLLAVYSKYPIINSGFVDFNNTKNNAIYTDILVQTDTLRIYNSHLQSFVFSPKVITNKYKDTSYWKHLNNTNTLQIVQANLIKKHAKSYNEKIIICGDFNATPYSQTYRILKKGFNDSFLKKGNGLGETYSLFNYPLRLDYFLCKYPIEISSHKNFNLNLSDHEPVLIKFNLN